MELGCTHVDPVMDFGDNTLRHLQTHYRCVHIESRYSLDAVRPNHLCLNYYMYYMHPPLHQDHTTALLWKALPHRDKLYNFQKRDWAPGFVPLPVSRVK